jgi:uncharacterized membrane protein
MAIVVLVRAVGRKKIHLLDGFGVVFFVAMGVVLAVFRPSDIDTWGRYAQAVAHGTLMLIVFGSVIIGKPFTESYARDQAPQRVWNTPDFHAFNRQISLVWGLAFLVGTISLIAAGSVDSRQFLLRLAVPGAALALAYLFTQKKAATRRSAAANMAVSG